LSRIRISIPKWAVFNHDYFQSRKKQNGTHAFRGEHVSSLTPRPAGSPDPGTTTHHLTNGSDHNRPTAYEVAVTINGRLVVAGFTARKTKAALLATAMDNDAVRQQMLDSLPADDDSTPSYDRAFGWALSGRIRVRFTGGTLLHPMHPGAA
jgi:hypothetical protein